MVETNISIKDLKELKDSGLRSKEEYKKLLRSFEKEDFINYMLEEDTEDFNEDFNEDLDDGTDDTGF